MGDIIEEKVDGCGNRRWYKNGKRHREGDQPAYIGEDGSQEWHKNGILHREGDQPAVIWADGTQEWYKNGKLHREGDEPAIIWANGTQEWYKNDILHREGDQPAIIGADGTQAWYKNGKQHREGDQPAVIGADGSQEWYKNDKLHRELGPAFNNRYFLEGIEYTRKTWLLKVTALQRTVLAEWWEERYRWRNELPERDGNQTLKLLGKLPRAALAEVLTQLSPVRD